MLNHLTESFHLALQIIKLPVVNLNFNQKENPDEVLSTYKNYTKPHPRYKFFRHKSIGVALIDLTRYRNRDEYSEHFKEKEKSIFYAKKAKSRGYVVREIEMNRHIDEIHDINTSLASRQGRPMENSYLIKKNNFESISNYQYYGVLSKEGKLVSYCVIGHYGDFVAFSQCLGHRNNDGCMHLMLTEVICQLIDSGKIKYVLFDTWFGAQPGLKKFKASFGFKPYRAKYSLI
jgi:hypothetical protein